MNSKQLANSVCKGITGRDLSDVPLNVAQELLDALNLTLAEWLQMLPADRRIVAYGATMRAPLVQMVNIVNGAKGFVYVSSGGAYPAGGYASEEDALGSTLQIDGMASRNQLQSAGTLLMPYLGPTSTNQRMTIYGDAVHLPAETWVVEGDVTLATAGGEPFRGLTYNPQRWKFRNDQALIAEPREWWMDSLAPLQEEDSRRFVLRVWPLPDRLYSIRLPICVFPIAFTMEDLFEARSLPLNSMEQSLFTMQAKGAFVTTTAKAENVDANGVLVTAQRASEQLKQLQRPIHTQTEFIGTPTGY
jgi:hypothetical protein